METLPAICPVCEGEGKVLSFVHGTVRVLPCRACRTPAGATS